MDKDSVIIDIIDGKYDEFTIDDIVNILSKHFSSDDMKDIMYTLLNFEHATGIKRDQYPTVESATYIGYNPGFYVRPAITNK